MKKHEIKAEWKGAWGDRYVVKCSCGFLVKNVGNSKDVKKIKDKHLEEYIEQSTN